MSIRIPPSSHMEAANHTSRTPGPRPTRVPIHAYQDCCPRCHTTSPSANNPSMQISPYAINPSAMNPPPSSLGPRSPLSQEAAIQAHATRRQPQHAELTWPPTRTEPRLPRSPATMPRSPLDPNSRWTGTPACRTPACRNPRRAKPEGLELTHDRNPASREIPANLEQPHHAQLPQNPTPHQDASRADLQRHKAWPTTARPYRTRGPKTGTRTTRPPTSPSKAHPAHSQ